MKLPADIFETIIAHTPLISIDFVIRNPSGQCLLGLRKNAPAAGYWFNLGGRIFKNETTDAALGRIFQDETGFDLDRTSLKFLGVFDHIYADNVFEKPGFGTHYINMAYEVTLPKSMTPLTLDQHNTYRWWDLAALMASEEVHDNTKICLK